MKNIILLAPPAAGKGTISNILQKKYGYVSLSTGDILREKALNDDSLKEIMASGKLIDDETVFDAVKYVISKLDKPYILDGFPRTVKQARMYDELLSTLGRDLGVVIYLNVPKDILIKRITSRKVCPICKRSYSTMTLSLKPKKENTCDDCNTSLITRADDTEETFVSRYNEYQNKTSELIDYYNNKNVLFNISSLDAIEIVDEISEIIR